MSNSKRYLRQIMLPEIGEVGQAKLGAARVLIVGMGGLGCPAAQYLTAVGVGHLTLLDHDKVDISNLHRQILYGAADIGEYKAEIAKERLSGSGASITSMTEALNTTNALDLVRGHDFVLDCSDNFRTRYLLSDACSVARKPLITAAISKFDAEIALLCDIDLPCYRCLFPQFTAAGKIQNCADAGVLGSFVGIVGTMQAHEVVKAIIGLSRIKGKLLCYQGLDNEISHYAIDKNPDCSCCSLPSDPLSLEAISRWPLPLPTDLCAPDTGTRSVDKDELLRTLARSRECLLIDVREPAEYKNQHIRGAHNYALSRLHDVPEIWRSREIIVYCLSGMRSKQALAILRERGFSHIAHLEGGIRALQMSDAENLLNVSS